MGRTFQPSKQGEDASALLEAANYGNLEIVKMLLDSGARVRTVQTSIYGATPLICAAQKGNTEIATLLIARGAGVNHTSKIGETPLMFASGAYGGTLDIILGLVQAG